MHDHHTPLTTHAAWGAGNPRLLIRSQDERRIFPLKVDEVTIGSTPDNTLQLPGTEAHHATVVHDDRDEYVVTLHAPGEMNANPRAAGTHPDENSETLRTGAHFTAGPWTFVFDREEFADHGRPHGGRQGGEFSHQPSQPARPDYTKDPEARHKEGREVPEWRSQDG